MNEVKKLAIVRLVLNLIMVAAVVWISANYGFNIDLVVPLVMYAIAAMLIGALSRF